ncbi:MAG: hypothetical protein JWM80_4387 [Cyanobacteria bacterium RYN_339]|nr:hypothetical protein [Cyanobacteria bacterium RYN_339]
MLKRRVTTWIYRLVIESPRAHELMLQLYTGSEGFHHRFPWFNRPELVDDPELQLLMRQHFADEDNHAKYFKLALTLRGNPVSPTPIELDYLLVLAAGFWDAKILVGETIEELTSEKLFTIRQNLFVQLAFKDLSEKKAIDEFHIWRDLAKTREPETYAILKRVVEDEDWHVKIFDEQVHKMMADPVHGPELRGVYKRLVKEARRLSDRTGSNFLHHLLDHGLLTAAKPWELRLVRLLATLQGAGKGVVPLASAKLLATLEDKGFFDRHSEIVKTA